MTAPSEVVLDASVFVRAAVFGADPADRWLGRVERRTITVLAPDLVYAEVANALCLYVRAGKSSAAQAQRSLAAIARLPLTIHALSLLAQPALAVALETGLSAYDACYLVLARAGRAVLVTADRRLAEAAPRSELLPPR